jgi:adenylosuccinate lyase
MAAVKKGGDRQALHEKLRTYSLSAKQEGDPTSFLRSVAADRDFDLSKKEIDAILSVDAFIGRSEEQVREFIAAEVTPLLKRYS